jgi:hypothetical protein
MNLTSVRLGRCHYRFECRRRLYATQRQSTGRRTAEAIANFRVVGRRVNAAFSTRGNSPSDQLAAGGRLPGRATPILDILGEER